MSKKIKIWRRGVECWCAFSAGCFLYYIDGRWLLTTAVPVITVLFSHSFTDSLVISQDGYIQISQLVTCLSNTLLPGRSSLPFSLVQLFDTLIRGRSLKQHTKYRWPGNVKRHVLFTHKSDMIKLNWIDNFNLNNFWERNDLFCYPMVTCSPRTIVSFIVGLH